MRAIIFGLILGVHKTNQHMAEFEAQLIQMERAVSAWERDLGIEK